MLAHCTEVRRADPERGVKTLNTGLSNFHSALSKGKTIKQGFKFFPPSLKYVYG